MAGSFGYKRDYYELSMAVGEDLREEFTDTDGAAVGDGGDADGHEGMADRTVVAGGTSCGEQLDAVLERSADHPVELLARALGER
jgi:Fe-S oxidoreductase